MAALYDKVAMCQHDFANQYNKWHNKTSASLENIKLPGLNAQYKLLVRALPEKKPPKPRRPKLGSKFAVDYNKFVDDLLRLTPHNQSYPVPSSSCSYAVIEARRVQPSQAQ